MDGWMNEFKIECIIDLYNRFDNVRKFVIVIDIIVPDRKMESQE